MLVGVKGGGGDAEPPEIFPNIVNIQKQKFAIDYRDKVKILF